METHYASHCGEEGSLAGPRERIALHGPAREADTDLLKAVLGSGSRGNRVEAISLRLLDYFDRLEQEPKYGELTAVPGLGAAKAAQIVAAWEFCRRRMRPSSCAVHTPEELLPLIRHYGDRRQEHFLSIPLNGAHEVMGIHIVSIGLVNRTLVHPREVFRPAIESCAAAILCAHNHPSGRLEPSREDHEITLRLIRAGTLLGIPLLDHLIFHGNKFYSFLSRGELREDSHWDQ